MKKLNSRRKGKNGEREAYKLLVSFFGIENVKNLTVLQTTAKNMPEIVLFDFMNIEIKRNEKWKAILKKSLTQSKTTAILNNIPHYAVMARGNHEQWSFSAIHDCKIVTGDIIWFKEHVNELQRLLSKSRHT